MLPYEYGRRLFDAMITKYDRHHFDATPYEYGRRLFDATIIKLKYDRRFLTLFL
ncbi:hypothetical protein ACMAV3_04885 [Helicobacter pylori]